MTKHDRQMLSKKLSLLLGLMGAGFVLNLPTRAQAYSSPNAVPEKPRELFLAQVLPAEDMSTIAQADQSGTMAPTEIEMSPEGMEILCERFPLNSRCTGETVVSPGAVESPDSYEDSAGEVEESEPSDAATEEVDPSTSEGSTEDTSESGLNPAPEGLTPPPAEPSEGMTAPGSMSPGSMSPGSMSPEPLPSEGTTVPDATPPEGASPKSSQPATPGTVQPAPDATQGGAAADLSQTPPDGEPVEPAPEPATPTAPPANTPAEPAPAEPTEPDPSAPTDATVSSEELQQFANVISQLREIDRGAQERATQAIETSGLSQDRFREIYTAEQSPDAAAGSAPTAEEQQAYQEVISQFETIQQESRGQKEQVLQTEGLEPERFNEILTAVRQDPSLQQQVQQMMGN